MEVDVDIPLWPEYFSPANCRVPEADMIFSYGHTREMKKTAGRRIDAGGFLSAAHPDLTENSL
jgi:hypothetical protein